MKTTTTLLILAVAIMLFVPALQAKDDHHKGHKHANHEGHDHDEHKGHDHNEHGKAVILEVGDGVAEIELNHDEEDGIVTLHVLKEGTHKGLKIAKAPRFNLQLKAGRKQVKTVAVDPDKNGLSDEFTATSSYLKGHIDGAISIKIDGKSYLVKLAHEGHDHDDHEGHDHGKKK